MSVYGPTNATICVSMGPVTADGGADLAKGQPINAAAFHVPDHSLQPVPTNVTEKLYIGGSRAALGYLHRPALNAKQILPSRRTSDTGDMLRATDGSDLVFCRSQGRYIELRRFRVEMDEIRAALTVRLKIKAAASKAGGCPEGQVDGTELVLLPTRGNINADDWTLAGMRRSPCGDRAPHILPDLLIAFALPFALIRKLDRTALRHCLRLEQLKATRPVDGDPAMPPLNDAISTIFRDLLPQAALRQQVNVYGLDANSPLAMDVVLRLKSLSGGKARFCTLVVEPNAADHVKHRQPDYRATARRTRTNSILSSGYRRPSPPTLAYQPGCKRSVHAVMPYWMKRRRIPGERANWLRLPPRCGTNQWYSSDDTGCTRWKGTLDLSHAADRLLPAKVQVYLHSLERVA